MSTNNVFSIRLAASVWLLMALLICLGTAMPALAEEIACQIDEELDGMLPILDPVRDTVRGGIGRTRERVYITPRLEHDTVQLRVSQEQVWAFNILELAGGSTGEFAETPLLENMQGRRLLVSVGTQSSARQRSFSYRLSAAGTPGGSHATQEGSGSGRRILQRDHVQGTGELWEP